MGTRRILITWCLLLLFTVLFGVLTMRLLNREQSRLGQAADIAARERLELASDSIRITVAGLRETILDEVLALPADLAVSELATELIRLERENPLVRNTFIWNRNQVLLHPQVGRAADREKVEFTERYDLLFDGSVEWRAPIGELEEANKPFAIPAPAGQTKTTIKGGAVPAKPQATGKGQQAPPSPKEYSIQETLAQAAKRTGKSDWSPQRSTRWISWHWLDQLYQLGVVFDDKRGLVYGVELETVALLARLHASLPEDVEEGTSISLQDRNGGIIHRVGAFGDKPESEAAGALRVPVGPLLDTYQMVGTGLGRGAEQSQRLSLWLSWLQVATFMLAILGTGSLLLWQAHRNLRDARLKTGFVSNVSHELKTPLTTIRMYAELLGEDRVTDPEKRQRYLGTIVRESQRLARLVNNVLDFGRLEQERRNYQTESLDLVHYLPALLESHNFAETHPDSPIDWSADSDACLVDADPDALEQILLNVIDNACKYAQSSAVTISVEDKGDYALLHVLDRGTGVPGAHTRKIFDKFHRVDDSLTSQQAGSGLGLSIARRLARGMGGDLSYRDRAGGGADFTLRLPKSK